MQQELIELQPKLIQTSKETEELIAIIEKEGQEVAEVKKVVEADEAVANAAANEAKAIKVSINGLCSPLYKRYFCGYFASYSLFSYS